MEKMNGRITISLLVVLLISIGLTDLVGKALHRKALRLEATLGSS
jgi:hypothetical protein